MANFEIILTSECDHREVIKAIKAKGISEEQMEQSDRGIILRDVAEGDLKKLKGIEGIFSVQSAYGR